MKHRVSKNHYIYMRQYLLHTTVLYGLALVPGTALANPQGGNVVGGSASISSSGNTLTVNQTTNRAIINWGSFNISSGETTQFQQPNSSSITLNRISSTSPSQINGNLTANGNIKHGVRVFLEFHEVGHAADDVAITGLAEGGLVDRAVGSDEAVISPIELAAGLVAVFLWPALVLRLQDAPGLIA